MEASLPATCRDHETLTMSNPMPFLNTHTLKMLTQAHNLGRSKAYQQHPLPTRTSILQRAQTINPWNVLAALPGLYWLHSITQQATSSSVPTHWLLTTAVTPVCHGTARTYSSRNSHDSKPPSSSVHTP